MFKIMTYDELCAEVRERIKQNWTIVTQIRPGDRLYWWTDTVIVNSVAVGTNETMITVDDKGEERLFTYKNTEELNVYKP